MKSRILLVLAAILLLASGMKAEMHYYAIYCAGDQSLHFLTSETQLTAGKILESNGQEITSVNLVERTLTNKAPSWNTTTEDNKIVSATTVVFEESFKDVQPASCHLWFSGFSKLTNIEGLNNLNTSNVTEFSNMFENCSSLASLDLSSFDTANVTTLYHMFMGCSGLESLDLSNFNTAKVTTMASMFSGCKKLTSLNLSNFDTANVESMTCMFQDCVNLTSLDLSSFDTANVTNMNNMFLGCENLPSLDLVSFDTSNVTNMASMFRGCENLAAIYVSNNFKTDKVTEYKLMFDECYELINSDYDDGVSMAHYGTGGYLTYALPLGVSCAVYFEGDEPLLFIVPNETSRFSYDGSTVSQVWKIGDGSNPAWNETDAKNLTAVKFDESVKSWSPSDCASWFYGFSNLTTITGLQYLNTENVTSMKEMFSGCSSLTTLDLSTFNTANVTNMREMFIGCSKLQSLELSDMFDTSEVTDMGSMFSGCNSLTSLDLSNFNTVNVTNMGGMFFYCSNLTSLDLSSFDTANVNSMLQMFQSCSSLTSLILSNFDTANVTSMKKMFSKCSRLTPLVLGSSFKTANVTDMSYMFEGCSSLYSLDLSNFDTANVTDLSHMFDGCSTLASLDFSKFNTTNVKATTSIFINCNNLRLLNLSNSTIPDFADFAESEISVKTLVFAPEGTTVEEGRVNVVIGNICENLVINYNNTNQLYLKVPREFTANKVSIKRIFTEGQPYTLYLPFEMDASKYGTFYMGGEFNETDGMVYFTRLTDEKTTANTPYMFQPNQDFTDSITIEGPVSVEVTPEDTETDGLNGVYEYKEFTADEAVQKIYYGWAIGEFCWAEEGAKVDACRAYFKLPASAAANAPARLKVKLGEDGTTGITDIDREDGDTESPAYNINGQRVTDGYRGIVIKNGQKTANFAR